MVKYLTLGCQRTIITHVCPSAGELLTHWTGTLFSARSVIASIDGKPAKGTSSHQVAMSGSISSREVASVPDAFSVFRPGTPPTAVMANPLANWQKLEIGLILIPALISLVSVDCSALIFMFSDLYWIFFQPQDSLYSYLSLALGLCEAFYLKHTLLVP